MITVLNTFDLIQHVHEPTHNHGHTLDLLISRGLNISSIVIKDVSLSDHFCIFDILISVTTEKTYPFSLEQVRCGSPDLPEGGSEAVTHMDNSQVHMEEWR